ncbi:hypothetical protein O3G_MSEX009150 [Manduca sexta]|uniref:Myotubularin phosphatase domain-containing protein n=1 Tax=Manduca sexta TaxID=7130 RepID=A0A922CR94_MANSE|nr:hypothetical protein O3G_MSEX009150 [Manduca sexta]
MRRIPAVVWRHRGNGAVIARSSQPEVGWLGWRSSEDERLLAAFVSACNADRGMQQGTSNKQLKLLIVDARSYASAVTNRARGGGCECQQYYPAADIQFMCLPNIHHVRRSFQQMRALAAEPGDQANWHSNLERTLWLQYVSGVLRAAAVAARALAGARPVLVHCSDGWDRTPQIVAAAQLVLDPYYRTLEGFRILIEREWLDFGHKFADRCGHQFGPEDPNERSPIFLQWLDVVHQMMVQFPCSFEFNDAYLIKLATHVHSCMFGTFLCNTARERGEARAPDVTAHVWHLLRAPAYRNHLYSPHLLDQRTSISTYRAKIRDRGLTGQKYVDITLPDLKFGTSERLMTKTRSCDNLLNEGEKRTTQRRCSDPSIAPDVMKLSLAGECRAALTDSCVDELPARPTHDQVDGLHPDHFENSGRLPRDIASGSSSLERELAGPAGDRVIEHGDGPVENGVNMNGVVEMAESVVRVTTSPDADTPEEPPVFVCDTYTDVMGIADAAREPGRTRNISITWRSISESSNQSSTGFDIETPQNRERPPSALDSRLNSHESSPMDNHNSTEGDVVNHNVIELTNHNRENGVTNGTVNGIDEVSSKFLEVDLNGGASSSSASSESEGEAAAPRRAGVRARGASQLTLCPASPRRACCHTPSTEPEHRRCHAPPLLSNTVALSPVCTVSITSG